MQFLSHRDLISAVMQDGSLLPVKSTERNMLTIDAHAFLSAENPGFMD